MLVRLIIAIVLIDLGSVAAATLEVPAQYATVQDAVDAAAPGDTVQVAAGTYAEQVVITTPLVLRGAGADETVIATPGALPHAVGAANYRAIVCVDDAPSAVTIADLTVDGLAQPPTGGRFVGVMYNRGGGRLDRVAVRDVRHDPVGSATSGIGVLASLTTPAIGPAIELADVTVSGFQKSGVVIIGRDHAASLRRVAVDGQGLAADAVPNGIELTTLTGASLVDCTIAGVDHDGSPHPDQTASGLLAIGCDDLEVTGAEIQACLTSVYLEGTAGRFSDLRVHDPAANLPTAHGLISVGGPIVTDDGELPAPRPTLSSNVITDRAGLQIYEVLVRDSRLDGGGLTGSRGVGLNTFSSRSQRLVLERVQVIDWQTGVLAREDLTLFGAVFGRFTGCLFEGNATAGIDAATIAPLDARGCQWGAPSGPANPDLNPDGTGDAVSSGVLFDPWLTGNLAPLPLPQNISLGDLDGLSYTDTITVEYLGGGDELLYGYSVRLGWDPAVVDQVSVEPPSRGAFTDADWFFEQPGDGTVQVDAALGGLQDGMAQGPLFTVTFTAVGDPDGESSPLDLELLHARDRFNQPVTGLTTDPGRVVVDLHAPQISGVEIFNESLDHTDLFAKDGDMVSVRAEVSDGNPDFGRGDIRGVGGPIFGAPWLLGPPDSFDGEVALWQARPVFTEPAGNGVRAFTVNAIDPAGNVSEVAEATITIDNTAPAPITGLVATAGHNEVALAWDPADGNDLHYRRTVVRARPWGDYPFYATPEPAYPDDIASGDSIYTGPETSVVVTAPADGSGRDILYLAALIEDMAGNVSPVTADSRARATNYRVGDVAGAGPADPGDGAILATDLERLAATIGRDTTAVDFDPECDLAPADSTAGVIPAPDARVDLDDLMLVAMRYDHEGTVAGGDEESCALAWRSVAADTFAVVLEDTCRLLKGVRVVADAAGASWTVEPGALLAAQPGPWFLSQGPDGACEAYLAVLGPGVGIEGQGELLRLVADQPADPTGVEITARGTANEDLAMIATAVPDGPPVDGRLTVAPPAPNPFNPRTTIRFEIPVAQTVRIDIHALDGRRVRRLLADRMPAGRHTVQWTGRDDAGRPLPSGTYLYRVVAGPWSHTGKLGLIR
ncbi:hypothetical protein GF314_01715 [bacterium]|nr:hypothetical protein [bacterium]